MPSAPTIMPTRPMVIRALAPPASRSHSADSPLSVVGTTTRSKPSSRTAIQHSGATQPAARTPVLPAVVEVELTSVLCGSAMVAPER